MLQGQVLDRVGGKDQQPGLSSDLHIHASTDITLMHTHTHGKRVTGEDFSPDGSLNMEMYKQCKRINNAHKVGNKEIKSVLLEIQRLVVDVGKRDQGIWAS